MASKYFNKKVTVDNITFDSKKESERYLHLKALEKQGNILDLELQPKFEFRMNNKKIFVYKADFQYTDHAGNTIIEDVKSAYTAKNPLFRLKKKLIEAYHSINIKEVL